VWSSPDRPLCVASVDADDEVYVVEGRGLTGSNQRAQHEVGLCSGLPLPSHSPPQEGREEAGVVEGNLSPRHSILEGPDLVRLSSSASSSGRLTPSLPRRTRHRPLDGGAPFLSGAALSSRLEDLRGSWGVNAVSDKSFRLIAAGWVRSSKDRYERAWQSFKSFLRAASIPLSQATLRVVLDYLTHLYDCGLSWSIHKSTISMTMAPVDGVNIGDHPLVKRLMRGVFKERPLRRANPTLWDPLKVLSVFQHWPVDLPHSSLMQKGAFLMALTTAKRASKLVTLLCDDTHFRWEGEFLHFIPSRPTKMDRLGHLAPPFYVMEGRYEYLPGGDRKTHYD
jgi:hypothetical protein